MRRLPTSINVRWLNRQGACDRSITDFLRVFGSKAEFTSRNVQKAKKHFYPGCLDVLHYFLDSKRNDEIFRACRGRVWAEQYQEAIYRDLLRLARLAQQQHKTKPTKKRSKR